MLSRASASPWGPATLGICLLLAVVLPSFLVASLAVRIRGDFPLSDSTLGLAVGISYGVAAITSVSAGRFVDRIGAGHGILAGGALVAASALGIALLAHSALALILLLAIAGLANALAAPGISALISHTMEPGHQGRAFGLQQAGVPAGALVAGLALPLIAAPLGWRAAFIAAALFSVAVVAATAPLGGRAPTPRSAEPPRHARRVRDVHFVALSAALAMGAAAGMLTFLVVFAVDVGIAEGPAGFLLAATSFAGVASRIGLGVIADRRPGLVALPRVAAIMAAGSAGLLLMATAQPLAIVVGALLVGSLGFGWTGLLMLVLVRRTPRTPGSTIGTMMVGMFTGAAGGPLLIGFLAEATTFELTWLCTAAMGLAAAVTLLAAERIGSEAPGARGPSLS